MRQRVSGASSRASPGGSTASPESSSTATCSPHSENGAPACPTPCAPWAPSRSSCSYQEWLQSGGPGGPCAAINDPGVITSTGVPIPGIGPSLNGSGGEDLIPQVGRNTFRYPGAIGLDARAAKRTSITEHIAVEVFAEAFNVLNHPNVTNIQTVGYSITNNATNTSTANLSYLTGLKTLNTTTSNGDTQTQLVAGPTAAFGGVTNTNSNALYHDREIQLGVKLFF